MKKLSVIIASANECNTKTLINHIDCNQLQINSINCVHSCTQLVDLYRSQSRPDLFIWDMSISDRSVFDFLNIMVDTAIRPIIITTNNNNFPFYKANLYHVYSCLMYSDIDHLTNELYGLSRLLDQSWSSSLPSSGNITFRTTDKRWAVNLSRFRKSLEQFNEQFGTSFHEGIYSAMLVKIDNNSDELEYDEERLRYKIKEMIGQQLRFQSGERIYYELLFDDISDSVLAFLNYSNANSQYIINKIPVFFSTLQSLSNNYPGAQFTLCVSREYSDYNLLVEAKYDVLDGRWERKVLGKSRIIYYDQLSHRAPSKDMTDFLQNLEMKITTNFRSLNEDEALKNIDIFFHSSDGYLSTRNARLFITNLTTLLFEIYNSTIDQNPDPSLTRHHMIYDSNMAVSNAKLRSVFANYIHRMIKIMTDISFSQYSPVISTALQYINKNYPINPTLSEVAAACKRAPSYLSTLFKKETGKSFSDYVDEYRINQAKRILQENTRSIGKLANDLGYTDVRYFSKYFKRKTGTTPSQYRKLFC